ncbi:MAG: CaiB/BaiF CoA-transferase family protein [Thermodesulfobacteriota bacterium]|nr:CaiB/BaiF CoA-transferase family protein [Thermodesulfobacteriota bacterium]
MGPALEGIRVLDLSKRLAGPFASTILSDFGAEVIRVAPLNRAKEEPLTEPILGQHNYYFTVNRNKKSILINLKEKQGRDVFYNLVQNSNVVIDNFRPGVLERLSIDFSTLSFINPKIICCSITGYGSTGPYALRPSYDGTIQALSGVMSTTGEPGGRPLLAGVPIADLAAPLFAAHAILAAVFDAERTGKGQRIETSMLASVISLLQVHAANYFTTGEVPGLAGSGQNMFKGVVHYGVFQTKDGYIFITAHRSFHNLCKAIGREDLITDSRFDTQAKRRQGGEELNTIAQEVIATRETKKWCEIFDQTDVPYAPINTIDEVFKDPQVVHLGVIETQEKLGQRIDIIRTPIKMPGVKKELEPAALPGENTEEILTKILGYSEATIDELRGNGINC